MSGPTLVRELDAESETAATEIDTVFGSSTLARGGHGWKPIVGAVALVGAVAATALLAKSGHGLARQLPSQHVDSAMLQEKEAKKVTCLPCGEGGSTTGDTCQNLLNGVMNALELSADECAKTTKTFTQNCACSQEGQIPDKVPPVSVAVGGSGCEPGYKTVHTLYVESSDQCALECSDHSECEFAIFGATVAAAPLTTPQATSDPNDPGLSAPAPAPAGPERAAGRYVLSQQGSTCAQDGFADVSIDECKAQDAPQMVGIFSSFIGDLYAHDLAYGCLQIVDNGVMYFNHETFSKSTNANVRYLCLRQGQAVAPSSSPPPAPYPPSDEAPASAWTPTSWTKGNYTFSEEACVTQGLLPVTDKAECKEFVKSLPADVAPPAFETMPPGAAPAVKAGCYLYRGHLSYKPEGDKGSEILKEARRVCKKPAFNCVLASGTCKETPQPGATVTYANCDDENKGMGCANWADILLATHQDVELSYCKAMCDADARCESYNYQAAECPPGDGLAPKTCYLYMQKCAQEKQDCWDLYTKPGYNFTSASYSRFAKTGCRNWAKLSLGLHKSVSWTECEELCNNLAECKYYNYQQKKNSECSGQGFDADSCYLFKDGCAKESNDCWELNEKDAR